MSLGRWVKDYLYIPLGGSREGEIKRTRNVIIAMLFTGLWHGLGINFLIWGLIHGILLALNHYWRKFNVKLPKILCWFMTFSSVIILWAVFRAENINEMKNMLRALIDIHNITLPLKFNQYSFLSGLGFNFVPFIIGASAFAVNSIYTFIFLIAALFAPNARQIMENFRPSKLWILAVLVFAVMSFYCFSNVSDFLYFQF